MPDLLHVPHPEAESGATLNEPAIACHYVEIRIRGRLARSGWNPLNRPKGITWADGSTTTLTWDAGNRLTQVVDSIKGTITRRWDDLDRLSYEQTPQGRLDYTNDGAESPPDRLRPGAAERHLQLGQRRPPPEPHLGLGVLLREMGRGAEARAELALASQLFRHLGMQTWLARVESEAAASG